MTPNIGCDSIKLKEPAEISAGLNYLETWIGYY
jgi:hypothetical protein